MAHPQGGSSSTVSGSNWNLEMLVFEERGKPEYPKKNLSEQGREPTTNSTHILHRDQGSNPGHIGERRVLSPLRHPCSPFSCAHVISTSVSIITIVVKLVGRICACGTSALTIRRETLQAMLAAGRQVHPTLAQSDH